MKSTLFVVIDPTSADIDAAVAAALEPFRLDEDDLDSIRGRHWDYWVCSETQLSDPELASITQAQDATAHGHAAYLRNLPADYAPSALIDSAGTWHDLQDHGWRMLREPSPQNDAAWKAWVEHVRDIIARHPDAIGVEVLVHS